MSQRVPRRMIWEHVYDPFQWPLASTLAALLVGAGFPSIDAACLALVANTAPVAFGALGTPIITLAKVSGLDEQAISTLAGRQLPFSH